jgi:hypothetical protein
MTYFSIVASLRKQAQKQWPVTNLKWMHVAKFMTLLCYRIWRNSSASLERRPPTWTIRRLRSTRFTPKRTWWPVRSSRSGNTASSRSPSWMCLPRSSEMVRVVVIFYIVTHLSPPSVIYFEIEFQVFIQFERKI